MRVMVQKGCADPIVTRVFHSASLLTRTKEIRQDFYRMLMPTGDDDLFGRAFDTAGTVKVLCDFLYNEGKGCSAIFLRYPVCG